MNPWDRAKKTRASHKPWPAQKSSLSQLNESIQPGHAFVLKVVSSVHCSYPPEPSQ